MKSFKKAGLIAVFILFAIGSTLVLKNSNTITSKQKPYAITKISYSDSFVIPDVNSSTDFNKLLSSKPTAAGSIDLINMVSSITKESVKSTISSDEHPLPLLAHWNTGDTSTGMTPAYMINLIGEGNHILPSWKLKPYWQKQLPESYYKESILKAKELNLPLTFIIEPLENSFIDNSHYFGLPAAENPNVIDLNSAVLSKLSPFGPNDLWSELGQNFSNSKILKNLQSWYPNPPMVIFVDNSTPDRLSWNELDNSKRFVDRFGNNTNDNFKHIVINAFWIEKYRQLHQSFKENLTDTWKKNTRFVSYNPISLNIGESESWIDNSTISNYDFSIYPLMSDAISVQYFAEGSTQSVNDAIFSLNNLPFVINQAHKQNSTFSLQLSISDDGSFDTLDKYRGFAQLALWLARPNIIREFNAKTNDKTTIMSRFKAIMDSVELIYNDETLQYFWKYGKLVANKDKKIGETSNVPSYYSKSDRWFLLNVDVNPQGMWAKDENIPVFAIALKVGTEPNRKWLLFIQSQSGDLKDIVITIPKYGDIVADSSAKGNFYIISEDGSSTLIPDKQDKAEATTVEQTTSTPVEQTSTTQTSTTQTSTTQTSTTQASTTQASTTQASTTQASTTQASTAQASTAQASTAQASTTSVEQTVSVSQISSSSNTTKTSNKALFISPKSFANVLDYGAVGDGTTDNSKAFKNAIAANPNIYIPDGVFVIEDGLDISAANGIKTIFGTGTITSNNNFTRLIVSHGGTTPLVDLTINGITIFGSMYLNGTSLTNLTISNCIFRSDINIEVNGISIIAGQDIYMQNIKILNNTFIDITRFPVELLNRWDTVTSGVYTNTLISGNTFTRYPNFPQSTGMTAVSFSGMADNSIIENNYIDGFLNGLELSGDTEVRNNTIINAGYSFMGASDWFSLNIHDNYFQATVNAGWQYATHAKPSNITVENNIFIGRTQFRDTTGLQVSSNRFYAPSNTPYAVMLIDNNNTIFEDNYLENTGSDISTDLWIGGANTGTITIQNNTRYTPNDSNYTPEYIDSSVPDTAVITKINNTKSSTRITTKN